MAVVIPGAVLDEILALQLTVAWAGEGACRPPRLGWWQTDLVDPAGGGDLLARLLPKTHEWAALEAAREVARRVDAAARAGMADPDSLRTLFFLGFELDEKLTERLRHHKGAGVTPAHALQFPLDLSADFSRDELASALCPGRDAGAHSVVPGGRQMRGPLPDAPALVVRHLAAGLVPLAASYPMPFYRVTVHRVK